MPDFRVHLENDFMRQGVAVYALEEFGQGRGAYRHWTLEPPVIEDLSQAPTALTPSLLLPDGMGHALLNALLDHYKLSQADLRLRQDYDAERKRVDKLTDTVIDLAQIGARR